MTAFEK